MKKGSDRMVVLPKDVMRLTGRSERSSRNIIARIKKLKGTSFVNVEDFCAYTGLNKKRVLEYLAENG